MIKDTFVIMGNGMLDLGEKPPEKSDDQRMVERKEFQDYMKELDERLDNEHPSNSC